MKPEGYDERGAYCCATCRYVLRDTNYINRCMFHDFHNIHDTKGSEVVRAIGLCNSYQRAVKPYRCLVCDLEACNADCYVSLTKSEKNLPAAGQPTALEPVDLANAPLKENILALLSNQHLQGEHQPGTVEVCPLCQDATCKSCRFFEEKGWLYCHLMKKELDAPRVKRCLVWEAKEEVRHDDA